MSSPPAGPRTGQHAGTATSAGGMGVVPTPATNKNVTNQGRSEYGSNNPEAVSGYRSHEGPIEMPQTGHFSNLSDQKQTGLREPGWEGGHAPNQPEDRSFAEHKPGCQGLFGNWKERYDCYYSPFCLAYSNMVGLCIGQCADLLHDSIG